MAARMPTGAKRPKFILFERAPRASLINFSGATTGIRPFSDRPSPFRPFWGHQNGPQPESKAQIASQMARPINKPAVAPREERDALIDSENNFTLLVRSKMPGGGRRRYPRPRICVNRSSQAGNRARRGSRSGAERNDFSCTMISQNRYDLITRAGALGTGQAPYLTSIAHGIQVLVSASAWHCEPSRGVAPRQACFLRGV